MGAQWVSRPVLLHPQACSAVQGRELGGAWVGSGLCCDVARIKAGEEECRRTDPWKRSWRGEKLTSEPCACCPVRDGILESCSWKWTLREEVTSETTARAMPSPLASSCFVRAIAGDARPGRACAHVVGEGTLSGRAECCTRSVHAKLRSQTTMADIRRRRGFCKAHSDGGPNGKSFTNLE